MNNSELNQKVSSALGCGERTASSVLQIMEDAGVGSIVSVLPEQDNEERILRITNAEGISFFAFIGMGYMVEDIRRESPEGESVYSAIN